MKGPKQDELDAMWAAMTVGRRWMDDFLAGPDIDDPETVATLQLIRDGARAEMCFPVTEYRGRIELRVTSPIGETRALIGQEFEIEELSEREAKGTPDRSAP